MFEAFGGKVDLLRLEQFDNIAIDVLTLSETWLDSNIQDSEICLPGFTLVRRDREGLKSGGGAVAIYVRDGLPFRVRNDITTGENECLWSTSIAPNVNRPSFVVCIVHLMLISPSSFPILKTACLLNIDRCDLITLGDMNVELLLKPAYGCEQNM